MALFIPPTVPSGSLLFKWRDRNNVLRDLSWNNSPKKFIAAGSVGLGGQRFTMEEEKYPLSAGTFLRQISTEARHISLPIVIAEESMADAVLAAEDLVEWFFTGDENGKTPGYLEITRPDGSQRKILAYYVDGLTGDLTQGGPNWFKSVANIYCPDPYPTAFANVVITKTAADSGAFSIINDGKFNADPIWRFDGPFTNISLYNRTTNRLLIALLADIGVGEYLIIDTRLSENRDTQYAVYDNTGASRISTVVPGQDDLWPLIPGQNNIEQIYTSGTSGSTLLTLTYLPKYRSILR